MLKQEIENYYDLLDIPTTSTLAVIKNAIEKSLARCEKGTPKHAKLLHMKTVFINEAARKRYDQQLFEANNKQLALEKMMKYKETLHEEEQQKQALMVALERNLSDLNQQLITSHRKRKEKFEKENAVLQQAHEKYIQQQQRNRRMEDLLNIDYYSQQFKSHYNIMALMMIIYFVCSVLYTFFGWSLSMMQMIGAYAFMGLTMILAFKAIRLLFARKLTHTFMALQDTLFLVIMYTFFF